MKMLAEYLEHALEFEGMARQATDAALKAKFQEQAEMYRKLADKRARQLGLRPPDGTPPDGTPQSN